MRDSRENPSASVQDSTVLLVKMAIPATRTGEPPFDTGRRFYKNRNRADLALTRKREISQAPLFALETAARAVRIPSPSARTAAGVSKSL